MFNRPTEAFREDILQCPTLFVHADPDGMDFQKVDECFGGMLGSLVLIGDLQNGPQQNS